MGADFSSEQRLPALDGLRGLAVLLVMLDHFLTFTPTTATERAIVAVAGGGWVGVDLFFVLSGYLISGIVLDHEGSGFFRAFYARRALRIVPAYLAFLAALASVLAAGWLGGAVELARLRTSLPWFLTFMSSVRMSLPDWPSVLPVHTWHLWSVSVEEQFYCIWPLALLTVPASRRQTLALSAIGGALGLRRVLVAMHAPAEAAVWLMPSRMDALTIGALLAIVERRGAMRLLSWPTRVPLVAWCAALGALLVCARWLGLAHPLAMRTLGLPFIPAAFGALLVVCRCAEVAAPIRRVLETRALRRAGTYSYALYLFHELASLSSDGVASSLGGGAATRLCVAAAGIALSFALARLSWLIVESPALAWKSRFPYPVCAVELRDGSRSTSRVATTSPSAV